MTPFLRRLNSFLSATVLLIGFQMPIPAFAEAPAKQKTLSVVPTTNPDGWRILQGEDLFAAYLANSGGKPIVYPIEGPGGQRMTRDFPMLDSTPGEKHDHDHHRSLWFTHGDVNGVDFWADDEGSGKIVQIAGEAVVDPKTGNVVVTTKNEWRDATGKRLLSDTRTFTFGAQQDQRVIDCELRLDATDGDVNFGDTKEGSFGIRVAGTMKVDAKLGGKITNAEGLQDGEAWGKQSNWVDYSGPVDGKTVGITLFYHPSSFAAPCFWHVRTYGLFAANPFGVHHFTGGKPTAGVTLRAGTSLDIRCRVLLHQGKFDPEKAALEFAAYAEQAMP
ncbi:DUF6807 domain-containing protein [Novipirellula artificiosorum]|uniref:Methane oxygenase PmoA n=1 Tax=Novipirellula artificiosorum TaxID=2528016 RepID=A0A5C6E201_9BACT|nr:PmoA family protein [Novipirellula artificiosorum]TWU42878.1 hypothetical protein Poly41_11790 [Novipirellula artificiosorum]